MTLSANWLDNRSALDQFEAMFCDYCGADFAITTYSFRMGFSLALVAAGLGKGDEIITSPQISADVFDAIMNSLATPVLIDCELKTALIDPQKIEAAITPRTKAIVATHVAGHPCDMDSIGNIARKHDLIVIEDAAYGLESIYKGRKIGNISQLTCFSLNGIKRADSNKFGVVTTNSPALADKMKNVDLESWQRKNWRHFKYFNYFPEIYLKCNFNLLELHAIFGIRQLQNVEAAWQRRSEIWQSYNKKFLGLQIGLPADTPSDIRHAHQIYTLSIDVEQCGISRDLFMQKMYEKQIKTAVHYIGVHLFPEMQDHFGYTREDFPNATWLSEHTVSIPLAAKYTDSYVNYLQNTIAAIFSGK